ncbi:MAG: hypothetical protein R3B91_02795 [Planctomycetaceae bacterium]
MIFDAIVRTNQSATFIGDAPVRRIDQLYLTGGSGESSVAAQQAAGGGGGGGFGGGGFGGGGGGFDGQRIAEDYENDDDGKGRSRSRSASRVAEDGMGGAEPAPQLDSISLKRSAPKFRRPGWRPLQPVQVDLVVPELAVNELPKIMMVVEGRARR